MKKRRFNIKCMVIPLLVMALLTACGSSKESTQQDMTEVVEETQEQTGLGEDNRYTQTGNLPITDNDALYEQTKDDQVVTMYLTVQSGKHQRERITHGQRSISILYMIMSLWEWTDIR